MNTELDAAIGEIVRSASKAARELAGSEPYLIEAAMKIAVRDFVWAVHEDFDPIQHELAEHLEQMAAIVQSRRE